MMMLLFILFLYEVCVFSISSCIAVTDADLCKDSDWQDYYSGG